MVRSGLRLILEAEDDLRVVGEAADGAEAIAEARRLRPDVMLMDVRMPRHGRGGGCRRLVEAADAKVVVLTTFDLDEHLFASIRAGASGFLLKASPPEELVAAIRAAPPATPWSSPDDQAAARGVRPSPGPAAPRPDAGPRLAS